MVRSLTVTETWEISQLSSTYKQRQFRQPKFACGCFVYFRSIPAAAAVVTALLCVHRATEVGGGTGKGGCHVECREYPGAGAEYVREFNNQAHKNKDAI